MRYQIHVIYLLKKKKKDPAQTPQSCPGVYLCSRLHRNVIAKRVWHSAFFVGQRQNKKNKWVYMFVKQAP